MDPPLSASLSSISMPSSSSSSSSSSPCCTPRSMWNLSAFRSVFLCADLKLCIFDYLALREIIALVECCRLLSVSHFTYQFRMYHKVDFAKLGEIIRNYQCVYEDYIQKSKLNYDGKEEIIPWSAPGCPESIASTSISSLLSGAFSKSSPSCLSSLRPSSFLALCSFHFSFLRNVDDLCDSSTLPMILHAKVVHFHRRFFGAIPRNVLNHSSIQEMYLHANFNRSIPRNSLPPNLKILDLGSRFNCPLEIGVLPNGLEELVLNNYKQPLEVGVLPAKLKKLHLGDSSHSQLLTVGALPERLEELELGMHWNERLQVGVLPPQLKVLRFTECSQYNRKFLVGALPQSLRELHLGDAYNCAFDNGALPSSLRKLIFSPSARFNRMLSPGCLPSSLEELVFGRDFNCSLSYSLLPHSLQRLVFGFFFNSCLQADSLPSRLTELDLGSSYDYPLEDKVLPQSLRKLKLSTAFNSTIDNGALPERLAELTLGSRFNKKLDFLPQNLRVLRVGEDFKQRIECSLLPGTLMQLQLYSSVQCLLLQGMLPWSLRVSYSLYSGRRRSDADLNGLLADRKKSGEDEDKANGFFTDRAACAASKRRGSVPNSATVCDL